VSTNGIETGSFGACKFAIVDHHKLAYRNMSLMTTYASLTDEFQRFSNDQLLITRTNNLVRHSCCLIPCKNSQVFANQLYLERWPRSLEVELIQKAVVNPGTTVEPGFAAPLATMRPWGRAFVALERPLSIVGRLEGARRAPLGTTVGAQVTGGTYGFTGQTAPVPVGNMSLTNVSLPPTKAAGIIVVSDELAKLSTPSAVDIIRNDMVGGTAFIIDQLFCDPTNAGVANEKPASILNAAPSFGSAGSSSANCLTDLKKIIADFFTANPGAQAPTFLMSPATAAAAIIATGEKNLDVVKGGTLLGIPTLTSAAVGNRLALIDAAAVIIGDDGDIAISVSNEAAVEFNSTPTSPVSASSVWVSLWESGLVGLKITRWINFRLGRNSAALWTTVAYV